MVRRFRQRYGLDETVFPSIPSLRGFSHLDSKFLGGQKCHRLLSHNAKHNRLSVGRLLSGGRCRRITPISCALVSGRGGDIRSFEPQTARNRSARRWYPDYWAWRSEMRFWGALPYGRAVEGRTRGD